MPGLDLAGTWVGKMLGVRTMARFLAVILLAWLAAATAAKWRHRKVRQEMC